MKVLLVIFLLKFITANEIADLNVKTTNSIDLWANVSYSSRNNTLTIKNFTDFTLLYFRENSEPNKDVVHSTFHYRLLLTMLYEIVSEEAGIEVSQKLRLSNRHRTFIYMLDYLDAVSYLNGSESTVNISQAVFVSNQAAVSERFQDYSQNYSIPIRRISNGVSVMDLVNVWSAIETRQNLENVFNYAAESQKRFIVATSAIFYSLNLVAVFPTIVIRDFSGVSRKVMTSVGWFNIANSSRLSAKILEIPTNIENTTLWILQPNEGTDLKEVQEKIHRDDLLTCQFSTKELRVSVPQFDIETNVDKRSLKNIGLKAIFNQNDLNINESENKTQDEVDRKVTLDNVIQGVRLQVRSLVTDYKLTDSDRSVVEFTAYQPFMFFLMYTNDRVNRVPIVVGKFHP